MRHVPEDELHPYLDQALSRSQCVEIETHLAECAHCRDRRDTIAALRDRTTALLGELTPRTLIIPPPFELLAERLSRRPVTPLWQIRLRRASLWAAGVVAAVGAGWIGRSILDPHHPAPVPAVQDLATSPISALELGSSGTALADSVANAPAPDFVPEATRLAPPPRRSPFIEPAPVFRASSAVIAAPLLQLASLPAGASEAPREVAPTTRSIEVKAPYNQLWQRVQWEDALEKVGSGLPYIEGMPVIGVLLREGEPGERPTSLVAQQDPSGEIVMSIEGPVARVAEVVKSQNSPDVHASEWTRTPPDYLVGPGGLTRRTNRILTVTGRLSVDSLNSLARQAAIR